jgi:hypothetical protein
MKAAPTYVRATLGFLAGAVALASVFVLAMTAAVLHSNTSHGSPGASDYWFAVAVLAALTLGFAAGAATPGRAVLALLPTRVAAITGMGAVAVLMIIMMLFGESLRETGSIIAGFVVGALAARVSIASRRAGLLRSSAVPQS